MKKLNILLICFFFNFILSQPASDKVLNPPGMPNVSNIYSGYLQTKSSNRSLHYILIQSQNDPVADPVVLWLNGGPGCSSLLGMFQEIGPYIAGNNYKKGDNLTRNLYSWTRNANVLFLQSPADVGFSINMQANFNYTDMSTADDAFTAILYFFSQKFPNLIKNNFFITGQSYAGKYIPDITIRILENNAKNTSSTINLKGILVGNGVMNFQNDQLSKSRVQYLMDHDFVGPHLTEIYQYSCKMDFNSPRCRFVQNSLFDLVSYLNPYNVYQVCSKSTTEGASLLYHLQKNKRIAFQLKQIEQCPNDVGTIQYLNLNKDEFKIKSTKDWAPCSQLSYYITPRGSIQEYRKILLNPAIKIWLYNGDWDDVVPYPDTLKGLQKIPLRTLGSLTPWFVNNNHAGFYRTYRGGSLIMITVKGAGHMVPQNKRQQSFQMFYNFINGKPINQTVPTS